jgi:uncharacterized membrane protein
MRKLWPGLVALAGAGLFSIWVYPRLPAEVVTHWGADGQPNGWSSPLVACLVVPGIGLVLAALFAVIPRIDPRRDSWLEHGATYHLVANVALAFVAGMQVLLLGQALGWGVPVPRIIMASVGGFFVLLGLLMPSMRPNWFMGIRTPWTLSSDVVWRKTHLVGRTCFTLAGLLLVLTSFFSSEIMVGLILLAVAAAAGTPVVYSWVAWKAEGSPAFPGNGGARE